MKKIFYGGTILTMADPMYAEAVLIENDKILALGSLEQLHAQAADCELVNLHGAVMLPGFIDPHSHFFQVAVSFLQASVNGCDTPEKMGRNIQDFIVSRKVQPGQWVAARDYDNNLMPGLKNPTLQQLDQFAPRNPLIIHHKSGHMGLLNSLALRQLGITPDTPCPEGGRIETENGKLTGYLEENAFFECNRKIPMFSTEQLLSAFQDTQKKYASYGITTLQDGMVAMPMLNAYRALLQKDQIYLDVRTYAGMDTYDAMQALLQEFPENRHLKCSGIKMFLDGSPQGRTAWMRTPYEGGDGSYCGYGTMTDEAVEAAFRMAAEKNTQIIAHCNGDGASAQFLRCLKKAEQDYPRLKELRPVIIHGQLLGTDQLKEVRDLGAMVSFFIAHVYHWGDVHIRNFGLDRASRISPANSALKAGIPFTFHQDAPVIEPDMLETIWCAVNRETRSSVSLGREEQIPVLEALKAVTVNAAYQYSEEADRGSIEAGKLADFVLLDRNPLEVPAQQLRDIQVLETYKDGKSVYCRQ